MKNVLGGTPRRRTTNVALLDVVAGLGLDGLVIEPYAIEVTRHRVPAHLAAPIKIAHLTDLHTRGTGRRERALLGILETERPDLIVVTGDTVDGGSLEPARDLFTHLSAPLGVWVVRGNRWRWSPWNERARTVGSGSGSVFERTAVAVLVDTGSGRLQF